MICIEAIGAYSIPLADFMVSQGYPISVVNPAKINAFAKSELGRAKTDKADAKLIARCASIMQPCNGQLKPDTFLGSIPINPSQFQRG
jgi:transposase